MVRLCRRQVILLRLFSKAATRWACGAHSRNPCSQIWSQNQAGLKNQSLRSDICNFYLLFLASITCGKWFKKQTAHLWLYYCHVSECTFVLVRPIIIFSARESVVHQACGVTGGPILCPNTTENWRLVQTLISLWPPPPQKIKIKNK